MSSAANSEAETPCRANVYESIDFEDYLTGGVHHAAPLWRDAASETRPRSGNGER